MKVLWKSDLGQGKHDPLEITHVVTKSGSSISADLVVPLYPHDGATADNVGLLEVIDAQLAAIDELTNKAVLAKQHAAAELPNPTAEHEALKEWADQFPYLVEELCAALGYARNPVGPTGIPELDILVSLSR